MSESHSRRPVVIRRKAAPKPQSHGTWKIAYADFMTALMTFFLVMWLLGSLNHSQLDGVSRYFRTPLKVAMAGGDKTSASTSAIPGGGPKPIFLQGEVERTTPQARSYHDESRRLSHLKSVIEAQIAQDPKLAPLASQIQLRIVPDGLRIRIFDSKRRPMFPLGSSQLEPYMNTLLQRLVPTLASVPNKITLTGHTDDRAYANGPTGYTNWELSSERANAARRALAAGGMSAQKVLRVIGAGDTMDVAGDSPSSALNRRITILVLTPAAEHRLEHDDVPEDPPIDAAANPLSHDEPADPSDAKSKSSQVLVSR